MILTIHTPRLSTLECLASECVCVEADELHAQGYKCEQVFQLRYHGQRHCLTICSALWTVSWAVLKHKAPNGPFTLKHRGLCVTLDFHHLFSTVKLIQPKGFMSKCIQIFSPYEEQGSYIYRNVA